MITGLIPYSNHTAAGTVPYRVYAEAKAVTITMAGMMKQAPATSNPRQPARAYPMWIAISVELGPGMRLVAPTRSRNI